MPLRFEADVSHADWFARRDDPWAQLCSFGPAVFETYAQLFHPVQPGDDPFDPDDLAAVEGHVDDDTLRTLTGLLAEHTTTPDDCFFGLWEGFGELHGSPSVGVLARRGPVGLLRGPVGLLRRRRPSPPKISPAFPPEVLSGPRVRIPHRDYLLFRGPLEMAGQWGAEDLVPGRNRPINSPNLMWPADHSWFVATEIDCPWTGVGGSTALVDELLGKDGLDVERVEPSPDVPYSRSGPGSGA